MTGYAEKFLKHLHESVVIGMILTICHIGMAAGAIEAMGRGWLPFLFLLPHPIVTEVPQVTQH